ncbi:MAG: PatB family C-S lyase [Deltaproteobacteria bacterium]|nr:MAG: PatB family C-S lyase [Deltaproteobacteria bacterium]
MVYDFDTIIDRTSKNSVKWTLMKRVTGLDDLIPLWVADMDFTAPPEVVEALKERAAHPIYGYTVPTEGYYNGLINWMDKRHGWSGVEKDWILYTPGVVAGFSIAIQAYSQPGDKVVIQPPVYYPFKRQILGTGRQVVENPLKIVDGYYEMDFEDLAEKIDERTRMIILCSPHNPVSRVWKREELEKLVEVCEEKDILIVSDEIHNDLILGEIKHTPTATISEEAFQRTITLVAPSKTFNLAGLTNANAIIPNKKLREAFRSQASKGSGHNNIFGMVAQDAAYNKGEAWLEELLTYLRGNLKYLEEFIAKKIPGLELFPLEGTYLAWVDCTSLGMNDEELNEFMLKKAKLWLDEGTLFGTGGSMFMRINLACPRSLLKQALENLEKAVNQLSVT